MSQTATSSTSSTTSRFSLRRSLVRVVAALSTRPSGRTLIGGIAVVTVLALTVLQGPVRAAVDYVKGATSPTVTSQFVPGSAADVTQAVKPNAAQRKILAEKAKAAKVANARALAAKASALEASAKTKATQAKAAQAAASAARARAVAAARSAK